MKTFRDCVNEVVNYKKFLNKEFKLISKPDGEVTKDCKVTIGKKYKFLDFVGSNVYIIDDSGTRVSISSMRFKLK